jgi:hypothetical protein
MHGVSFGVVLLMPQNDIIGDITMQGQNDGMAEPG